MQKTINMIDQMIYLEEKKDKQYKAAMQASNRAQASLGESAMLFQLKTLRELVVSEYEELGGIGCDNSRIS